MEIQTKKEFQTSIVTHEDVEKISDFVLGKLKNRIIGRLIGETAVESGISNENVRKLMIQCVLKCPGFNFENITFRKVFKQLVLNAKSQALQRNNCTSLQLLNDLGFNLEFKIEEFFSRGQGRFGLAISCDTVVRFTDGQLDEMVLQCGYNPFLEICQSIRHAYGIKILHWKIDKKGIEVLRLKTDAIIDGARYPAGTEFPKQYLG